VDEARVLQESALFIKYDIAENIQAICACGRFRKTIAGEVLVGRKLDFLCQELTARSIQ